MGELGHKPQSPVRVQASLSHSMQLGSAGAQDPRICIGFPEWETLEGREGAPRPKPEALLPPEAPGHQQHFLIHFYLWPLPNPRV